jgi:hypothetical protein
VQHPELTQTVQVVVQGADARVVPVGLEGDDGSAGSDLLREHHGHNALVRADVEHPRPGLQPAALEDGNLLELLGDPVAPVPVPREWVDEQDVSGKPA